MYHRLWYVLCPLDRMCRLYLEYAYAQKYAFDISVSFGPTLGFGEVRMSRSRAAPTSHISPEKPHPPHVFCYDDAFRHLPSRHSC